MGRRKKEVVPDLEEQEANGVVGTIEKKKEEIDRSLLKAPINEWQPTPETTYLYADEKNGKKCIIPFERIYGIGKLGKYREFVVSKDAYANQLHDICKYVNFFIYAYDKDQELLAAYLNLRYSMTNEEGEIYFHGEEDYPQFIAYLYEVLFTDSIIEKIHALVEDNYLDDIEVGDSGKKYVMKEKKHLESLEFTNEHIKTLLKISFSIKIMVPIIFHYYWKNGMTVNKNTSFLFQAYQRLFDIFGRSCNMYNKLFVYVDKWPWRTLNLLNCWNA